MTQLDPGDYSITIKNLSLAQEHNFHLTGPGVDMASAFDNNTVTWDVTLRGRHLQLPVRRAPDADEGLLPRRRRAAPAPSAEEADRQGRPEEDDLAEEGHGAAVKTLVAGRYKVVVTDATKADNFHLTGPGVNKKTGVKFRGAATWTLTFKAGQVHVPLGRDQEAQANVLGSASDAPAE